MSEHMSPIPSRIYNAAVGGHVAGADQIIDDETGLTLDKVTGGALEEKTYTSGSDNGMGRVVLRKNLVNGVNTLVQTMINKSNTIYVIQYDFTLGEDITVPADCILEFDGGSISGTHTITGNNTQIISSQNVIFTNVIIAGSWNVSKIYSNWFNNSLDALKQVFNLASQYVLNEIYIDNKTYVITPIESRTSIIVPKNTKVFCNGIIELQTSNYIGAKLFGIKGNTTWIGGTLSGDIDTNQGDNPSYGHGFEIEGSYNNIVNVNVTNCNGDGIYIAEGSKNINIDSVTIEHCSRNGISVIGDTNIKITNCIINGVRKTDPKAGIDIEPNNSTKELRNIEVRNLKCSNSNYGVSIAGNIQNSGNINISNLYADDTVDYVCSCFVTKAFNVIFDNIIGKNFIITYGTGPISILNSTITNLAVGTNLKGKKLFVKDSIINIVLDSWIEPTAFYIDPSYIYNLVGTYEDCTINWDENNDTTKSLALRMSEGSHFTGNNVSCTSLSLNTNTKNSFISRNRFNITALYFAQSGNYITLENNYIEFSGEATYPISLSSLTNNLECRLINNIININMVNRLTLVLDAPTRAILFTKNTIIDDNDKLMNIGANNYGWSNYDNIIIRSHDAVNTKGNTKVENGHFYFYDGAQWVDVTSTSV